MSFKTRDFVKAAVIISRAVKRVSTALFFAKIISFVDLYTTIEYKSLGCYVHDRGNKMTVLEGEDPSVLNGNYKLRTDAIGKCALAAMKKYKKVFAIQDGGLCLVNGDREYPDDPTFNTYGISQDCKGDGKGGPGSNHVYIIGGIKGMKTFRNKVFHENSFVFMTRLQIILPLKGEITSAIVNIIIIIIIIIIDFHKYLVLNLCVSNLKMP